MYYCSNFEWDYCFFSYSFKVSLKCVKIYTTSLQNVPECLNKLGILQIMVETIGLDEHYLSTKSFCLTS